ncbi:MAG: O-succinylhomoserine sulfhydrylase [Hyphomicrobiales bacterium]
MSDRKRNAKYGAQTNLIHGGTERSQFGETSEAIFMNSGYTYESAETAELRFKGEEEGFIYTRFGNPTTKMFEDRLAILDGAEYCYATATGMAAANTSLFAILKAGDHIVAGRAMFGSNVYIASELLPRFGVESTIVDGRDVNAWKDAIQPNTKVFLLETPTNPGIELVDIKAVSELCKANDILLIVDNVFATSILQRPFELGADIVFYSATKLIDGQGRAMAGAVLCNDEEIAAQVLTYIRQTGPSCAPFNAWVMLKGLETLALRVNAQTVNAEKVADFLYGRTHVKNMLYPFHKSHPQYELAKEQMSAGGNMLAIEFKDQATAFKFCNALELILYSNNLGDTKSLICHPATTTHQRLDEEFRQKLGITAGLLRLNVGLEDVEDLIADIEQALAQL